MLLTSNAIIVNIPFRLHATRGCYVGSYQGTGFSRAVTFPSHPVFLSMTTTAFVNLKKGVREHGAGNAVKGVG